MGLLGGLVCLRVEFPIVAQQRRIQLGTMKLRVRSLASLSGLGIRHCHELWGKSQTSDLALLWLWCRPAATAPILPLAWELPYAVGTALKERRKEGRKEGKREGGREGGKEGRKERKKERTKERKKGKKEGRKEGRKEGKKIRA